MAILELTDKAGFGFNMKADSEGYFVSYNDPKISTEAVYDDGKAVIFEVYGDRFVDEIIAFYVTDGFNFIITDLNYLKKDKIIGSLISVDIHTTSADLESGSGVWTTRINAEHDIFKGNKYADVIRAGFGDDDVYGNAGNDILYGETGADWLVGGKGADKLYGGTGVDLFIFNALTESTVSTAGRDVIFDFTISDYIDVSALDANSKKTGNQAFTYIGTAKFGGHSGELRYDKKASDTYIYADVNGDKKADFSIQLDDAVKLVKADFLL
jgi:Ca2+-binding RTX toxin-like protein